MKLNVMQAWSTAERVCARVQQKASCARVLDRALVAGAPMRADERELARRQVARLGESLARDALELLALSERLRAATKGQ